MGPSSPVFSGKKQAWLKFRLHRFAVTSFSGSSRPGLCGDSDEGVADIDRFVADWENLAERGFCSVFLAEAALVIHHEFGFFGGHSSSDLLN